MGKYHVYVKRTGIVEIIESKEDFSALLHDLIGEDAAEYFDAATSPKSIIGETDEDEFAEKGLCSGECICVQRTQEHFENLLHTIGEVASEAYDKMLDGYKVGGRRTKKEEMALDALTKIMGIVNRNT